MITEVGAEDELSPVVCEAEVVGEAQGQPPEHLFARIRPQHQQGEHKLQQQTPQDGAPSHLHPTHTNILKGEPSANFLHFKL